MGMAGSRLGSAARLSLVALVCSFALAAPAQAAFPGANGKIAFARPTCIYAYCPFDIFTMNPDGTNEAQLTDNPNNIGDANPAWSPDGTKIAFQSSRDGNWEIYTMNADGSGVSRLTNNSAGDISPTWSPDGTKIAFGSNRDGGGIDPVGQPIAEIYRMNADGTGQTRLSFYTNCGVYPCPASSAPSWSPDGTRIAFQQSSNYCSYDESCDPNFRADIFVMNADGSGATNLTNNPSRNNSHPDWSPDAAKIAFDAVPPLGGFPDIAVMNPDGTGVTFLTYDSSQNGYDQDPAWSPDGRKIAFSGIFVINADGTNRAPVSNPTNASAPSWQPSYHHPQSASQLRVPLVPAFKQCGTGANPSNAKHSPPLATNSCNPPSPGSVLAAVGSTSQSSAQMTVTPGDTDPTNGNQANVSITASLTDIQAVAGGDYNPNASGADLTAVTRLRLTDNANGYGGLPATATEYDFKVPIDCSSTANPTVGSTCTANTTANALVPGLIQEQRQSVVQAFRVRIDDSGANGIPGDSDDRIFMTQGILIP
jgi:hypothetical protein